MVLVHPEQMDRSSLLSWTVVVTSLTVTCSAPAGMGKVMSS